MVPSCEIFVMNNIVSVFSQATIAELSEGMQWYNVAQTGAKLLATQHNISITKAAGVIAALSPNLKWDRNIKAAEIIIKSYQLEIDYNDAVCPAYKQNRKKAYQILDSDGDYDTVKKILNGPKITSFFCCIMEDPNDVCIDGHAFNIYFGERNALKNGVSINKTQYKMLQQEYINATDIINKAYNLNLLPYQVQAVCWIAWRRIHNIK
jgi:hypothetical protein